MPEPPPPKLLGYLQVTTNAPDTEVRLNGERLGVANPGQPLEYRTGLPAGSAELTARAPEHQDQRQRVSIQANEWTQVTLNLTPEGPDAIEFEAIASSEADPRIIESQQQIEDQSKANDPNTPRLASANLSPNRLPQENEFPLRYGPTPPGAALWRVAREMCKLTKENLSVQQMAIAIYRNNRDPFPCDSINCLVTGSTLIISSAEELHVLNKDEAAKEFKRLLSGGA